MAANLTLQIKYDFHQLSEKTSTDFRNALLELLPTYSKGPRCIMVQLCVSLAALALQLKSWTTAIPDVIAACGTSSDSLAVLLQFLAVLPEEAYDSRRTMHTVFWI
jgi:transportin-3